MPRHAALRTTYVDYALASHATSLSFSPVDSRHDYAVTPAPQAYEDSHSCRDGHAINTPETLPFYEDERHITREASADQNTPRD